MNEVQQPLTSEFNIDVDNVESFNDLEMSMLFVEMIKTGRLFMFTDELRKLGRKYEKEKGEKKKIDLIFVGEDLGKTDNEKVGSLRVLKAIRDLSNVGQYVNDIVVKSEDPNFVWIEPNVFNSGIRFEILK